MRQYELWWADLPTPSGRRPVLLLSRDQAFQYLTTVIAVEITTVIRAIPQELRLGRSEGLARRSAARFDSLHSVSVSWLHRRIGKLAAHRIPEAKRAMGHALAWIELLPPPPTWP
ncbi:MAG: type II toxin-antitoxin system PemK/MazF family toxin [Myxococcales bacterium]|nr:type II toxin-antitoxin system PemK/MazF family toxin [Myxococcales bacterium]